MIPGHLATAAQPCLAHGRADTRLYAEGWRCPECTPAALAGHKEPDTGRYCAPWRCYCGDPACPAFGSYTRGLEPIRDTVVDARAVASGRRRSKNLAEFRGAQARVQQTRKAPT